MGDRNLVLAAIAAGAMVISCCTISCCTVASAGDLPLPKRYPPPPAYPVSPWTGFYVGGHIGAATTSDSIGFWGGGGPDGGAIDPSGKLGGLQGGYNFQVSPQWVIGIEEEFSFTSVDGTQDNGFWHIRHNWYDTLDARLGYVMPGGWLMPAGLMVYAKGGAAWMNGDYTSADGVDGHLTRSGWDIGAGAEFLLARQWSVKAEYSFLSFGQVPLGNVFATENHVNQFKLGVNYHFVPGTLFGRW